MEYLAFDTFGEVYRNISKEDTILRIRLIYSKYRKELILRFLGAVAKDLGFDNDPEILNKIQLKYFGISFSQLKLLHRRAIMVMYQFLYEIEKYNAQDISPVIGSDDLKDLFLLINHFISKKEYNVKKIDNNKIPIEILQAGMRMSIDLINRNEIVITNELFIEFYESLLNSSMYKICNKALKDTVSLNLEEFLNILYKFKKRETLSNIFSLYDKFGVMNYGEMNEKWLNRKPKIEIPFEYRFLEKYPLIKFNNQYFPVNAIQLFYSVARKPYHLLTSLVKDFRSYFSKFIVEPIIKKYIKNIFETDKVKIFETDFQDLPGVGIEFADLGIVFEDTIILIEIKSVYMGLEQRYNEDPDIFKNEFDKRYVYNDRNKFQLLNQLEVVKVNFPKFFELCNIPNRDDYNIYSLMVVFDEALSAPGFKQYLGYLYNDKIKDKINSYKVFLPFPYSNLLTYCELISIDKRVPDKNNRYIILKNSFNYNNSLTDFLEEIKQGKWLVNGLTSKDIKF